MTDTVSETEVIFEVWQNGDMVAAADSLADAEHFMLVYGHDSPVEAKTAITTRFPGFNVVTAMLAASPQEAVPTKREAALADLAKLDGETMDLEREPQWAVHNGGPNPVPGKVVEGQYPGETRVFHGPSEGVVWGRGMIYRITEGVKP